MAFPNPQSGCEITTGSVLPQAVRGAAISYTIATTGCTAPIRSFGVVTGSLPPGMEARKSGTGLIISGIPTSSATYAFSVRAVDASYRYPSKPFVIRVNPPLQIDTPAAASGATGASYSDTIRARGGIAPYTFSIVEGALPAGLTLAPSTGVIGGTMPAAGTQFRVRVTDSSSVANFAEFPYTIVASGAITTVSTPPVGTVGTAYSYDIDGPLGAGGFALALGALPTGLSMDANGVISGSPVPTGEFHFTVRQTAGSVSVWRSYRIFVNGAGTVSGTPRDAELTFAYEHVFSASGGVFPYTFSVSAGSLPTGLTLNAASGALTGEIPIEAAALAPFTISAVDTSGRTYSQVFSITGVSPLVGSQTPMPPSQLPAVRVNQNVNNVPYYSLSFGGPGKTFTRIGGTGNGLIFVNSATGNLTYSVPTPGVFSPVVLGTDSLGGAVVFSGTQLTIVGSLAFAKLLELPNGRTGQVYNATPTVLNGNFGPLTFSIIDGTLPAGLSINAGAGAITGTPDAMASGGYPFTIRVTDAQSQVAERVYFIGISQSYQITTNSIPAGTIGAPYSIALTGTGSPSPLWTTTPSALPPGITLGSSDGVLSGTPTLAGTYTFEVQLSEPSAIDNSPKRFTINVTNPLTASIAPPSPLNAYAGGSLAATVTPTGGQTPMTLSVTAGSLPEGLHLQSQGTLQVTGVPAITGTSNVTIQVTDADGRSVAIPYTIIVRDRAVITSRTLATPTRTFGYTESLTAEGGAAPYSWSLSSGSLPTGLSVSTGGSITGIPSVNGTYNFVLLVTDANGVGDERPFTLSVTDALFVTGPVPLPNGSVLAAYSEAMITVGGAASKTFSISSGNLPPLLAINPDTGVISNLPLLAGTYVFTVFARDSEGRVWALADQITIGAGIAISPSTVPNGALSTPYSVQFTAVGAVGAVTWSTSPGALPAGLSLNTSTGLLSGTPTSTGSFAFTVQAVDSMLTAASANYTMQVPNSLTIAPASVPNGTVGTLYSQALTATVASGAVSWAVISGALPGGLTLGASSGIISGTPTAPGAFAFTVQATDGSAQTGTRAYAMTVFNVLNITPATAPNGIVGTAYSQALAVTNGTGAVSWAVVSGTLPGGLTLGASSGIISGTPTLPGTFAFTVSATDSLAQTGTRAYSITVLEVLNITPATVPNGTVGTAYNQALAATNATGAVSWAVTVGTLPAGLNLGAGTGIISGTPTASGTATFTVQATDSLAQTGTRAYSVTVAGVLAIAPTTIPNGTVGASYVQTLTATGGTGAVTWAITAGALPGGLTLGATSGAITGAPTTAGTFTFTVGATDTIGQTGARAYSMTVAGVLSISPTTLPDGNAGVAYLQTLTATGATGAVTWAVTTGALPGGLTLGATSGTISGAPTAAGAFSFTVVATDSLSQTGSRAYSMAVGGALTIAPATLPGGNVGVAYNQTLTAAGTVGGPPVTGVVWNVSTGALPAGLTLGATTGLIGGTPSTAEAASFTVTVTASGGQTGARAYALNIVSTLTIAPPELPNGTLGVPYSQPLAVTGAAPGTVSWSIGSGTLPAGLVLNSSTGLISGTPALAGFYTFIVQVLDSQGQSAQRQYTVGIFSVLTIAPQTLPSGAVGTAYSQQLTVTGAAGAVSWSIGTGTLPAGLTLNSATGLISGTPALAGAQTFTVNALDSLEQSAQRQYTVRILNVLTIAPAILPDGTVGTAYSQALTATPTTAAVSWSVTAGSLPAGLTLGASTGVLGGTPGAPGVFAFTVHATDSLGQAGQRAYTMTVVDPLSITTTSLPDGTEQDSYSATLTTNSTALTTFNWTIINGSLPPGLALSASGVISGSTSVHGTYPFTVRVTNALGQQASRAFSILVVESLTITTQTLGEAIQGSAFTGVLRAAGGRSPYVWSLSGTALPSGLSLNAATGQITGNTSVPEGSFAQNAVVTDSRGRVARRTVPLAVTLPAPPSLSVGPGSLPNGRVGQSYSAAFSATGGTPGYAFAVAQGQVPPGLSLASGTLAGTPSQEGTFRFTVNATDSAGRVAGNSYTVVIEAAPLPLVVTPASIAPAAPVGQALSLQFGATGGKGPYTFTIANPPPGMSSNSSGLLSGTPSQGGAFTLNVEATDSLGTKASRSFGITFTGDLRITTQPPLPEGTVGKTYAVTFTAAGGKAPFAWSLNGAAPAGLAFDIASGTLSGTPTAAGIYPFAVTVQDSQRLTATASFSITIYPPLEIANTPAAVPLVPGQAFSFAFATQGGKTPVTLVLSSGALPAGLTMNSAGVISGTPTTPGAYPFTVQATDALGNITTQSATLRVVATLTVTTTSLPAGTAGIAYTAPVAATGGEAPLGTWSIAAGALPAGLSLAPDGTITGIPTAPGTATFTVRITDAAGTAATQALSILIVLPPLPPVVISGLPQTLPPGTQTNITIQLAQPFPVTVTGTLTLVFEPNAVNNADDPAVQFSSGGRTVTFTIPAGQTSGIFPVSPLRILSGTVAGTIRIRTVTVPDSATPVPDSTVPITRSVPVITAGTAQAGTGTFTLLIDGFSNTREIASATFRLTPTAGAPLVTTDVPVAVGATFTAWYQSTAAAPFGGQFRLTLPFTVTGALTDIESVTVTLTNAVGTSQPFIVRLR